MKRGAPINYFSSMLSQQLIHLLLPSLDELQDMIMLPHYLRGSIIAALRLGIALERLEYNLWHWRNLDDR